MARIRISDWLFGGKDDKPRENSVIALYRDLRARAATSRLGELLQSLIILAGEVQNQEVLKWAKLEAGGYLKDNPELVDGVTVPEYRAVVGLWHDRYGRPLVVSNPELAFVNELRLRNGVAELERLSRSEEAITIVPPDQVALICREFKVEVDRFVFAPVSVEGVLSAIRLRLVEALGKLKDGVASMPTNARPPGDTLGGLDLDGFHPLVVKQASTLFADGHYRQAILDTYIALVERVKAVSGKYDLDNTPLMQNVFSLNSPKLQIGRPDEQQGFMWLFSGAVSAIRNPNAHAIKAHPDRQETLEWLAFASVLFRALDRAKKIS